MTETAIHTAALHYLTAADQCDKYAATGLYSYHEKALQELEAGNAVADATEDPAHTRSNLYHLRRAANAGSIKAASHAYTAAANAGIFN